MRYDLSNLVVSEIQLPSAYDVSLNRTAYIKVLNGSEAFATSNQKLVTSHSLKNFTADVRGDLSDYSVMTFVLYMKRGGVRHEHACIAEVFTLNLKNMLNQTDSDANLILKSVISSARLTLSLGIQTSREFKPIR